MRLKLRLSSQMGNACHKSNEVWMDARDPVRLCHFCRLKMKVEAVENLQILRVLLPSGLGRRMRAQVETDMHAPRACVVRFLNELLEHADASGVNLRGTRQRRGAVAKA